MNLQLVHIKSEVSYGFLFIISIDFGLNLKSVFIDWFADELKLTIQQSPLNMLFDDFLKSISIVCVILCKLQFFPVYCYNGNNVRMKKKRPL